MHQRNKRKIDLTFRGINTSSFGKVNNPVNNPIVLPFAKAGNS